MKRILGLLLLSIAFSFNVYAYENFITAGSTLYPSGCATLLGMDESLQGQKQLVIPRQLLPMWDTDSGTSVPTEVTVYRMGCADGGRSVILVEIYVPNYADGIQSSVRVPFAVGHIAGTLYPLRLEESPNSYLTADATMMLEGSVYTFFLDGAALNQNMFGFENYMSPDQYNGGFDILLTDPITYDGTFHGYDNTIPRYTGNLKSSSMPINGRLSGIWASPGAEDQGFLISFNELFTADGVDSFIFLSWYTYDLNGNLLWLTGGTVYEMGDHSVRVNIELVENGTFLGSKRADRRVIGYVDLTAKSCSELEVRYDLNGNGMGSGNLKLNRIMHVETAGYACDDLQNRFN